MSTQSALEVWAKKENWREDLASRIFVRIAEKSFRESGEFRSRLAVFAFDCADSFIEVASREIDPRLDGLSESECEDPGE